MAATAASSSIRASSRHNGAGPSTAESTTASHSDLNTSATTIEVDEADLEDDDDEDYQPIKPKTSSPRKRPGQWNSFLFVRASLLWHFLGIPIQKLQTDLFFIGANSLGLLIF